MKSADYAVSAGASGAVFAVMGAMLYVVIRIMEEFRIFPYDR